MPTHVHRNTTVTNGRITERADTGRAGAGGKDNGQPIGGIVDRGRIRVTRPSHYLATAGFGGAERGWFNGLEPRHGMNCSPEVGLRNQFLLPGSFHGCT